MRTLTRLTIIAIGATAPLAASLAQAPTQQGQPANRDSAQRLNTVTITTSITGRGVARGASAVDGKALQAAAPGTSALNVIQQLPGVNVQSADGLAMYEWANRITMRGFQTQQIGQTMDGIPLGDMSYGNFNGLGIGRAVDPSNVTATQVTQGTGGLGTASANNLGGVVQYASSDPSATRQLLLQQMGGGDAARRTTLRYDTGLQSLGDNSGANAYLSISRFDTDKWKSGGKRYSTFPGESSLLFGQHGFLGGAGQQWQDQLNAKANLFVGPHKFTAFYDYAERKESDYMDLSLSIFDKTVSAPGFTFGPDFDYLASWAQSKQLAELSMKSYDPLSDAAYFYSAQGAREDHLAYLRGDFALTDATHLEIQPYLHLDRGGGDWHAPSYGASWSPDPIMFRQTQYHDNRGGVLGKLTSSFETGSVPNKLEVGGWYESNDTRIRRPRWRLTSYQNGPDVNYSDVIRLDFDRTGTIGTTVFYAQNTTRLLEDRLAVTYGAKFLYVSADFKSNGNTPTDGVVAPVFGDANRPTLSAPTKGGVLPQVGVVYRPNQQDELFTNVSQNVNQFPYSPGGGVYNASASTFDFFLNTAKPEKATTFEVGGRTRRAATEAGLTLYTIAYRNRLLGIALCPPTATCATGFGNVGSVTSAGIEGVIAQDLGNGFKATASGSFNSSTFDGNYRTNQSDPKSEVATKGKTVQDAPKWIGNVSLAYTNGRLSANAGERYVGERFFTYTNDLVDDNGTLHPGAGKVPSYLVTDLSARYRLGTFAAVRSLELQLNVNNLFDKRYISTMGSNGYTPSSDFQTLLTGAPRQFFVTVSTVF
jgi:iron complex outermembrane receptor protein